ncbi:MAG: tRNA-dihydrouridine synthase, partial [Patescibacteria group bacterium]
LNRPLLALAPMAGITDSAMRQICREHGADVVYSEMASATALFYKPEKTLELVKFTKKERPYVVQLFGKEPKHFAPAAEIITTKIKPDGIDSNFGRPAKKVFGHGSGCALMPQKKLARAIIKAVCDNTTLPVSLKIRAGLRGVSALHFIKNVKDLPFSAIMVHGRTYEGSFSGEVDFKIVEEIKKIISDKIVLANGGITTPEQAVKILRDYPLLDGLGIARGVLGKPYLFAQIKGLLQNPSLLNKERCPEGTERYDFKKIKKLAIRHAELLYKNKKTLGLFEIRKHLVWYFKGFPGAAELRKKMVQVKSIREIKDILK